MDLLTFIGWTLVIWLAYKAGVYVEHKMKAKAKAQAAQTPAETTADADRKP